MRLDPAFRGDLGLCPTRPPRTLVHGPPVRMIVMPANHACRLAERAERGNRTMRKSTASMYAVLTPQERARLVIEAEARRDFAQCEEIVALAPTLIVSMRQSEFQD